VQRFPWNEGGRSLWNIVLVKWFSKFLITIKFLDLSGSFQVIRYPFLNMTF
jgi:hypothetical protein